MTSETAEKEASTKAGSSPPASTSSTIAVKKATKTFANNLKKVSKPAFELLCVLAPIVIQTGNKIYYQWTKLDDNIIKSIIGFAFCFFGGMYPTLFAGVQAAEQGGRALVVKSIGELSEEATRIINESKKDDKETDPKKQLTNEEFMRHKTLFVLEKMNPQKVDNALRNIYSVWFAIIAVLVVQFARTIQMANSISDFLTKPVDQYVKPVVNAMLPPEYRQWTPVLLNWFCKTVGMALAWTLASIRVAFASSLQGGLMLSRSGIKALRERNVDIEGMIGADLAKEVDDHAAFGFAAIGFLFQLYCRLSPPFPFNIIMFPFKMAEWALRYGVMKASSY